MRAGSNWRHLNGLSLGMMGDPVRCLPKVVHPDVAALKLQHNRLKRLTVRDRRLIVGRAELGYTYAQLAAIERLQSADAARKALKLAVLRLSAVMPLASRR